MAYSFVRKVLGGILQPADINDLQAAIEDISANTVSSSLDIPAHALPNMAVGAATHIDWGQSTATFTAELDRMYAEGIRVVRSDISWRTLETAKGVYSSTVLAKYDNAVAATLARGMTLILTLFEVPDWAHTGTDRYVPPASMLDFQKFCSVIANRYRQATHVVWELWNEPSLFGTSGTYFWNPFGKATPFGGTYPAFTGTYATDETTAAQAYADMATHMYRGIKSSAPHHLCLWMCPHLNDPNFIGKVYDRIAASWNGQFAGDAVSIHPYCSNHDPYDVGTSNSSFLLGITATRALMDSRLDHSPIWITEFGYNSGASAGSPLSGADDTARDLTRGGYFERAIDICRQYPYVRCMCLFTPSPVESVSSTYDYSLYKSGAFLASWSMAMAKSRSSGGGRVAATGAVAAAGVALSNNVFFPVVMKGTDVEDTDLMHYTQDTNITGTVSTTSGSTALVGTGTAFTTDLSLLQVILIGTTNYVVVAIADNTHLTLHKAAGSTTVGTTAQRRADYLVAPYAGGYSAVGWFQIPANGTGVRMARLKVNGNEVSRQGPTAADATNATGFNMAAKLNLARYDLVSMEGFQNSGGSLTVPASGAGLSLVKDTPLDW